MAAAWLPAAVTSSHAVADGQTKKEAMRAARKRKHAGLLTVKSDGSGEESSDAEDASRKSRTRSHKPAPYKLPEVSFFVPARLGMLCDL